MNTWKDLFSERILRRGRKYYREGRVLIKKLDDNGDFSGLVNGSEQYQVSGNYWQSNVSQLACGCPYALDGNNCKHMVVMILAVENAEKSVERQSSDIYVQSNYNIGLVIQLLNHSSEQVTFRNL